MGRVGLTLDRWREMPKEIDWDTANILYRGKEGSSTRYESKRGRIYKLRTKDNPSKDRYISNWIDNTETRGSHTQGRVLEYTEAEFVLLVLKGELE